MKVIFKELIKNLGHAFVGRENSTDNKVKISSKPASTEDFVCLEILDNGNIPEAKIGLGHRLVLDIVTRYGGRFQPLMQVSSFEDAWRDGYRKRTVIYLPRIPLPQEIAYEEE